MQTTLFFSVILNFLCNQTFKWDYVTLYYNYNYDMIFMDIQMPEMDGYEATRIIMEMDHPRAKTVPIIAMTANVFREDVEKCLAFGMNDHVGKPLDFEEVLNKLREYLL